MGLFDAFKRKEKEISEEINPMYNFLYDANLSIANMQVVDTNGSVSVRGTAHDGETIEKVEELLATKGVGLIYNELIIADLSRMGIQYRIATKSSNLNCRKGPSAKNEVVGKFPKGTIVDLIRIHNATWHFVKNDVIEGYCHTDYLETVKGS